MPQPMQPIYIDNHGVARFKENAIVRALLDTGKLNLNDIALLPFSDEDREQLAQLIGYSVSGFGELNYSSLTAIAKADEEVEKLIKNGK